MLFLLDQKTKYTWSAEGANVGSVRLIKRRLEYVCDSELVGDLLYLPAHLEAVLLALNDIRTGEEEERLRVL